MVYFCDRRVWAATLRQTEHSACSLLAGTGPTSRMFMFVSHKGENVIGICAANKTRDKGLGNFLGSNSLVVSVEDLFFHVLGEGLVDVLAALHVQLRFFHVREQKKDETANTHREREVHTYVRTSRGGGETGGNETQRGMHEKGM